MLKKGVSVQYSIDAIKMTMIAKLSKEQFDKIIIDEDKRTETVSAMMRSAVEGLIEEKAVNELFEYHEDGDAVYFGNDFFFSTVDNLDASIAKIVKEKLEKKIDQIDRVAEDHINDQLRKRTKGVMNGMMKTLETAARKHGASVVGEVFQEMLQLAKEDAEKTLKSANIDISELVKSRQ